MPWAGSRKSCISHFSIICSSQLDFKLFEEESCAVFAHYFMLSNLGSDPTTHWHFCLLSKLSHFLLISWFADLSPGVCMVLSQHKFVKLEWYLFILQSYSFTTCVLQMQPRIWISNCLPSQCLLKEVCTIRIDFFNQISGELDSASSFCYCTTSGEQKRSRKNFISTENCDKLVEKKINILSLEMLVLPHQFSDNTLQCEMEPAHSFLPNPGEEIASHIRLFQHITMWCLVYPPLTRQKSVQPVVSHHSPLSTIRSSGTCLAVWHGEKQLYRDWFASVLPYITHTLYEGELRNSFTSSLQFSSVK